jgi:hypothetical protein
MPDSHLYTPEMVQAERELDGRIDHALSVAAEVQAKVDEFERHVGEPEPPTDAEVDRIRAFVLGHARTDEWQPVLDRINRGELTWRQVVEGLATGHTEPAVAAAFDSLSTVPPASFEKLVEIGIFPASLPDEAPEEEAAVTENDDDDDQWFDENPLGLPNR